MSGPRWMMQNEAGLFWRAKGNGTQALACLRQALHSAPPQHRDMPLVNTANLLLHYGLHDEAHELLQQALVVNRTEVWTDTDLAIMETVEHHTFSAQTLLLLPPSLHCKWLHN